MYGSLTILAHSNHKQFSAAGTSLNRAYKDVWGVNIEVTENKLPGKIQKTAN